MIENPYNIIELDDLFGDPGKVYRELCMSSISGPIPKEIQICDQIVRPCCMNKPWVKFNAGEIGVSFEFTGCSFVSGLHQGDIYIYHCSPGDYENLKDNTQQLIGTTPTSKFDQLLIIGRKPTNHESVLVDYSSSTLVVVHPRKIDPEIGAFPYHIAVHNNLDCVASLSDLAVNLYTRNGKYPIELTQKQ